MATPHDDLLRVIASCAASTDSFDAKAATIFSFISGLSNPSLRRLLAEAGFIPERYAHDSSEEKLYAKAMDSLVAIALNRIGYRTEVSPERSNSADVTAAWTKGSAHTIVLDAKAFRLSRTALNPKDYKIEALSTWKKGADYASLIGPVAGFPAGSSRLFAEAIRYNITLLTFSHLAFMLEHGVTSLDALSPVWNASTIVKEEVGTEPSAEQYWTRVDKIFCESLSAPLQKWHSARRAYFTAVLEIADEQIEYYEQLKRDIRLLSREELADRAIQAMKIDGRIGTIMLRKIRAQSLLDAVEN